MKVYIVRHATAVPHGTPGVAEDDRPLTDEGTTKMEKAARGLQFLEVLPDLILTSPLPRARQTADILRQALGEKIPLKEVPALAPLGNRSLIYKEMAANSKIESLMLVGHQPSLGEIAGEIAWGSAEHYLELKKGGICALEVDATQPTPRGTLLWLATPAMLRCLAR
jgi:phosphohistidine phosphatase